MAKSVKQKEKEYKEKHNLIQTEAPIFKVEERPSDKVYNYIKDKHECYFENNVLMFKDLESREQYKEILNEIENKFGSVGFSTGFILKA